MRMLVRLTPLALIVALVATAALASRAPGPAPASADTTGPSMTLAVSGAGLSCDSPDDPTSCTGPLGTVFHLFVRSLGVPAVGYVAFQSLVYYDGLSYLASAVATEIVWPESALPARFPAAPASQDRWVSHGSASAGQPPLPASSHTGPLVDLMLACSGSPSSDTVALVAYDAAQQPLGAAYRAAAAGGGLGPVAPVKTAGTLSLDLSQSGTPKDVSVADVIDITCEGLTHTPTATRTSSSTATPTQTQTPSPTATPVPNGDADCNGRVDSIDALLLLQLGAGLLSGLPCGFLGDVNEDGEFTSIDAALILQFVAGLIPQLPA